MRKEQTNHNPNTICFRFRVQTWSWLLFRKTHVNENDNVNVNEHVNVNVNEHVNVSVNDKVNEHVHVNENVNVNNKASIPRCPAPLHELVINISFRSMRYVC